MKKSVIISVAGVLIYWAEGSNTTSDHNCLRPSGQICHKEGYNRQEGPNGQVTVYTELIHPQTAVKEVDDRKMSLTFEPYILILWQDPRLKITNVATFEWMPLIVKEKIWIPKLSVTDEIIKTSSDSTGFDGKLLLIKLRTSKRISS